MRIARRRAALLPATRVAQQHEAYVCDIDCCEIVQSRPLAPAAPCLRANAATRAAVLVQQRPFLYLANENTVFRSTVCYSRPSHRLKPNKQVDGSRCAATLLRQKVGGRCRTAFRSVRPTFCASCIYAVRTVDPTRGCPVRCCLKLLMVSLAKT